MKPRALIGTFFFLLLFALPLAAQDAAPKGGPAEFKHLKYRLIGPAVGGRVSRACGVPGDPLTYYAATASGGVWKSSDGGISWKPIFDDQPIASIGSIAVAPSDPNVIYVGSGEANIRGNVAPGNGIYKSTDAGKTWKHTWKQEGQIGTMVVHPKNADVAYAAVLGHAFGPNPERGVYRTADGGKSWQKILYKDPDTGASDVAIDPSNPRILFAGLWQARRQPWDLSSGGPGSGLYVSRDGGDTWKQLTGKEAPDGTTPGKGLPEGIWGKIGVAVAPSDGRRVYALIEAEKGGLFRSDDGGDTWSLASGARVLRQRAWYYSTLTIDPKKPDVIWCPQVPMVKSIDGGKTFKPVKGFHHGDHHDLWVDPLNPMRMIGSNDGGVDLSVNGGESWLAPPLPIGQFYHVTVDTSTPYRISGSMQDLGTAWGPSNSLATNGISNADWHDVGGGEAGHTAHDPTDPNIVYAGEYGGFISRYDHRTRQARNVSTYPFNPSGHGAEALRYRFQWTAPILVSPHDPKTVYHAANVLFVTKDGGQSWTALGGDLTRNDKSKQKWSGGPITGDNTGVEVYGTIFAIAESPKAAGILWAGSDDGLVHVSQNGGKSWTNVTANIPNFPEWGTVACLEASPFDAATAYLVVDAHRLDNMKPYLYKTSDFGKTWQVLSASLPQDVFLHVVREDPAKRGMLYAGTEKGLVFSRDDGKTWQELKLNFPTVAVHDLVVKNNDLIVGTHGRSIWIFDDLTALRAWSPPIAQADVHLFPVTPAVRYRYHSTWSGRGIGQNPPQGAIIEYVLKTKPKAQIKLEIFDSQGKHVTSFKSKREKDKKPEEVEEKKKTEPGESDEDEFEEEERPKKPDLTTEAGVNRIAWDLHQEGAEKIPGAKIDAGIVDVGPLVSPGSYVAKLTVEGKTLQTTITVLPDPRVTVTPAALDEQMKFAAAVRDEITKLSRAVKQIRGIRKQIQDRNALLKDNDKTKELVQAGKELVKKLDALEEKLHNPKAEVTYDILAQKGGAKLYSQYGPLYEYAKSGDGAPTQGMVTMHAEFTKELAGYVEELRVLMTGDLAKLNELAKKLEIPNILPIPEKEKTETK